MRLPTVQRCGCLSLKSGVIISAIAWIILSILFLIYDMQTSNAMHKVHALGEYKLEMKQFTFFDIIYLTKTYFINANLNGSLFLLVLFLFIHISTIFGVVQVSKTETSKLIELYKTFSLCVQRLNYVFNLDH